LRYGPALGLEAHDVDTQRGPLRLQDLCVLRPGSEGLVKDGLRMGVSAFSLLKGQHCFKLLVFQSHKMTPERLCIFL
jgi:hypothetical protein